MRGRRAPPGNDPKRFATALFIGFVAIVVGALIYIAGYDCRGGTGFGEGMSCEYHPPYAVSASAVGVSGLALACFVGRRRPPG